MGKLFSNLLFNRAKNNKFAFVKSLKTCYDSTIPYIQVKSKTRKYRKRVKYQLKWINKKQSEKFALSAFKKHVYAQPKNQFSLKLSEGFKSIEQQKKLRDNIHKLALKYLPKKYKKINKMKYLTKNSETPLLQKNIFISNTKHSVSTTYKQKIYKHKRNLFFILKNKTKIFRKHFLTNKKKIISSAIK